MVEPKGALRRSLFAMQWIATLCFRLVLYSLPFVLLVLPLSACRSIPRSTPPVIKVGLLAPFEGGYRSLGYEALEAMRAAIADSGVDAIPLALDTSGEPVRARRAAEKLLVDPDVVAVVGPLLLNTAAAVQPLFAEGALPSAPSPGVPPLIVPFAVDPAGGFRDASALDVLAASALDQTRVVANAAVEQGAERLLLASDASLGDSLVAQLASLDAPLPLLALPPLAQVELDAALRPTDALLWFGTPDAALPWIKAVRALQPNLPVWLSAQANAPLFVSRTQSYRGLYWSSWHSVDYTGPSSLSPSAQLVYSATRAALWPLANSAGAARHSLQPQRVDLDAQESKNQWRPGWEPTFFQWATDGSAVRWP